MISVILPTLWAVKHETLKLLEDLQESSYIDEIVLIDNNPKSNLVFNQHKIHHVKAKRNNYVNASWNLGVSLSKNEKLLILNDDVNSNWELIQHIEEYISPKNGLIGLGQSCWDAAESSLRVVQTTERVMGFGCLFFIHKESYIPIPKNLKIWYGDDFLNIYNLRKNRRCFEIQNWPVMGQISATLNSGKFDKIIEKDNEYWASANWEQFLGSSG